MKINQASTHTHTVKSVHCVEFINHTEALGFFLVLMSDRCLTKSPEIQDQIAMGLSAACKTDFIIRALNGFYGDNFRVAEIYLSI